MCSSMVISGSIAPACGYTSNATFPVSSPRSAQSSPPPELDGARISQPGDQFHARAKGTICGMDALPAAITDHLDDIRALCVKYRVKRLAVFGSAVKGTFDPATSDVDFVVEFQPEVRGSEGWHAY